MPPTPEDAELLDSMRQRELHVKRRQRTADLILFQVRRYRASLVVLASVTCALLVTIIFQAVVSAATNRKGWWLPTLVVVALGLALGENLGHRLLRTRRGRALLARREGRLRRKHSGELHAGRRWLPFYYRGEDISPFVAQILYLVESEHRFDSVQEALDFARANRPARAAFDERTARRFDAVAAETKRVVVSSADESGEPSSRLMRFVTSERPGVWYVTTAPDSPKVHELDLGRIAILTAPTESGATISSNQVTVRRAPLGFRDVVDLYRAQVPGYIDGMTEEEQDRELVYEVSLRSARLETWLERDVLDFSDRESPAKQ
jgi:hypothetical protein